MSKDVNIWLVGNTGLRNPNRIQEGFSVFAKSEFVGNLHGPDNEIGFTKLLNEKHVIQNEEGKDPTGSHARKWRLMFRKNGFIYPQLKAKEGKQDDLGPADTITPFGWTFLKADTMPAVQECFLRSMSVEQFPMPDGSGLFSPLRWMLSIMLELEHRTGSSEISRIEFALWGHATDPSYDVNEVVDNILDLRARREEAPAKKAFDKREIDKRAENYSQKASNFKDYADMNMRYLRISGVFQRKGRGLVIAPAKHAVAEELAKPTASDISLFEVYQTLCNGAPLPTDNIEVAREVLNDLVKQMKDRHIAFDISDLPLTTAAEINIARRRLENILVQTDEIQYAEEQHDKWQEISDYMTLLINGGGKKEYDEENVIEVPKDEAPAYLEWTLWRAALAIDHLTNKPYEVRGFRLDSDFLPVSTAGGGKGDLYCEFDEFTILTEVTMSTSSRQEAMEGAPVRSHVAEAVAYYGKPVYGLFIAVHIDTNTTETFRHGLWYTKDGKVLKLDIVPMTLAQFQKYFNSMFASNRTEPAELRDLILECEEKRDFLQAPAWNDYIDNTVTKKAIGLFREKRHSEEKKNVLIPAGATIYDAVYGTGTVVGIGVAFNGTLEDFPYLFSPPSELTIDEDTGTAFHPKFGNGEIYSFVVVFQDRIRRVLYPCSPNDITVLDQ